MRNQTTEKIKFALPEGMGKAMKKDRMEAGIAKDYFENAPGCGIALKHHLTIFFKSFKHVHPPSAKICSSGFLQPITYLSKTVNYFEAEIIGFCGRVVHLNPTKGKSRPPRRDTIGFHLGKG